MYVGPAITWGLVILWITVLGKHCQNFRLLIESYNPYQGLATYGLLARSGLWNHGTWPSNVGHQQHSAGVGCFSYRCSPSTAAETNMSCGWVLALAPDPQRVILAHSQKRSPTPDLYQRIIMRVRPHQPNLPTLSQTCCKILIMSLSFYASVSFSVKWEVIMPDSQKITRFNFLMWEEMLRPSAIKAL